MTSAARGPTVPTRTPPAASAPQLGAVASRVVGREGAAVQGTGDAVGDQRAEEHVLDPVAEAADRIAGDGDGHDRPGGLEPHAGSLQAERGEGGWGGQPPRDPAGQSPAPRTMPAIQAQTTIA
jgi:hypothetical protein